MPGGEGGHSDMYVPSLPQTQTHPPTAARAKYELRCAAPAQGCGRGGGPGRTCAEHVGAEAGWWWCVVRVQRLPPRQVHVRPTSPRDTESCRRALSVSSSLHLAAPTDQVRARVQVLHQGDAQPQAQVRSAGGWWCCPGLRHPHRRCQLPAVEGELKPTPSRVWVRGPATAAVNQRSSCTNPPGLVRAHRSCQQPTRCLCREQVQHGAQHFSKVRRSAERLSRDAARCLSLIGKRHHCMHTVCIHIIDALPPAPQQCF